MYATNFHIKTQKEQPADSDIVSYSLMIRAGMVKKLSAGIYTYMPIGLKVIKKIENIIRVEMNLIGGVEILTPMVQPAELWKVTKRWDSLGSELLRIKDRHSRDFVFQPTAEEVFTDLAQQEINSWKQLPKIFYQIQTKFRDERRPRFGIMRAREFIMKDAYSFDLGVEQANQTYEKMMVCYKQVFDKIGLEYKVVKADTGNIGGTRSNEFQVIAETGEDEIAYCKQSDFSENVELAKAAPVNTKRSKPTKKMELVNTPQVFKCEEVATFLGVSQKQIVKSLVLVVEDKSRKLEKDKISCERDASCFWMILLRSDHTLNELKLSKVFKTNFSWRFANNEEIQKIIGSLPGSIGPVGLKNNIKLLADRTVEKMSDFVVGANQNEFHLTGVNWGRDIDPPDLVEDIRNVLEGDLTPDGKGEISIQRGIEVGHIFYLGKKYSEEIGANVFLENGTSVPMEMGCYGIGVSRLMAAAIEQGHDARGIIWPKNIAPFTVVICPIGILTNALVRQNAEKIYFELIAKNCDVILDDRVQRPGVMFAEWELIGIPFRITLGPKSIESGKVELFYRREQKKVDCDLNEIVEIVLAKIN